ncbi:hypothetical protein O181_007149 [Austropuccinia psidii MF-1]|uniref:GAG-pre-integrase domain-containing protein n=1 Tax=Austropuccinia psidii MF-1 TaxID=1389203 RepID=A0A9Q3BLD9_9BASI|nr:hypothetical protein [Austropuccinia psidii MF-1]
MVPHGLYQPAFNQLLTAQIFGAGGVIPTASNVSQIVLSTGVHSENTTWHASPFINRFLEVVTRGQRKSSPFLPSSLLPKAPSNHSRHTELLIALSRTTAKFSTTAGRKGIGGTIASHLSGKLVSLVRFIGRTSLEKVLVHSGMSIHLIGASVFASNFGLVPFFTISLSNPTSSILILRTVTLNLPVSGGTLFIAHVAFTRQENVWWLNLDLLGGTNISAAVNPPNPCNSLLPVMPNIEMNPIAFPSSTKAWNARLGHPNYWELRVFLKAPALFINLKTLSTFACETCAKTKRAHCAVKQLVEIKKDEPLEFLVSNILGPLGFNPSAPG